MSKSAFERMSTDELCFYNSLDVRLTSKCWSRCQADLQKEAHVYAWAKRAAVLGQTMQLNGIAVDTGFRRQLSADLKAQCDGLLGEMRALTGVSTFNPYKAADLRHVLFKQFGAPILKATKKGFSSTDKAVLTALAAQDTEAGKLARLVQEFRYVNNVRVRCVDNLEMEADGRIHASWRSFGTISWRFACVAPWTEIRTKRGRVPIFMVQVGDFVWTHKGRWRQVLDVFSNGFQPVYNVRFCNGEVLTCTSSHRLLQSNGRWQKVKEIYDRQLQALGASKRESRQGVGDVPVQGMSYDGRYCESSWDYASLRVLGASSLHAGGGEEGPIGHSILSLQKRGKEPAFRQTGRRVSKVERALRRWTGLLDRFGRWRKAVCSPGGDGESFRYEEDTVKMGCSPYRQQSEEQRHQQSSTGNSWWAQEDTYYAGEDVPGCRIEKVDFAGSLEVYDLTVDEDESYEACGVFSHNCRKPNLQNFNRMKGGLDPRGLFVAKPGYVFVYFDVGQAEMRFAAYLSQDARFMAEVEEKDVYTARAKALFRAIPTALEALEDPKGKGKNFRHLAKTSSLAANYMISADNLWVKLKAEGMNVDYRTVTRVLDKIHADYEDYFAYVDSNVRLCQKVGFLQDPIIGLKRRLGFYPPPSDCANFPIQSGIGAITVQRLHEIQSRLDPDCLMVLQVHDSCAVETPEHKAESVVKIVRDVWSEEVVLGNGRRFLLPIDLKCGTRLSEFS